MASYRLPYSGRLQRAFRGSKGMNLSVAAYALWGSFGIAATLAAGWVLFGRALKSQKAGLA